MMRDGGGLPAFNAGMARTPAETTQNGTRYTTYLCRFYHPFLLFCPFLSFSLAHFPLAGIRGSS